MFETLAACFDKIPLRRTCLKLRTVLEKTKGKIWQWYMDMGWPKQK